MTANNSLQRAGEQRGRPVLARDGVLAEAECRSCMPLSENVRRHMEHSIRIATEVDLPEADAVAVSAFREYRSHFSDWDAFSKNTKPLTHLSKKGSILVATAGDGVVGAVSYVGPGISKGDLFKVEWAALAMLVVSPEHRNIGIGRALTKECINRAGRDGASAIALHTSKIMTVALPMYQRLGFRFERELAPIFGVPYSVYVKELADDA